MKDHTLSFHLVFGLTGLSCVSAEWQRPACCYAKPYCTVLYPRKD